MSVLDWAVVCEQLHGQLAEALHALDCETVAGQDGAWRFLSRIGSEQLAEPGWTHERNAQFRPGAELLHATARYTGKLVGSGRYEAARKILGEALSGSLSPDIPTYDGDPAQAVADRLIGRGKPAERHLRLAPRAAAPPLPLPASPPPAAPPAPPAPVRPAAARGARGSGPDVGNLSAEEIERRRLFGRGTGRP
jgi:hypothetical protein